MKLKVYKVRNNAKIPKREHNTDAGADMFYCPERSMKPLVVSQNETVLIPTGIKVGVPEGYMLEIKNKSGVAYKRSLVVGACVVDSGYDGEIFVNLHNIGTEEQTLQPGEKVAQAVLVPVVSADFEVIQEDDVYGGETSRGTGALGSTGTF